MKRKLVVILCIIAVIVTGCQDEEKTIGGEYETVISQDIKNPAVYLGVLENGELLYYQSREGKANFYIYNFFENKRESIGEVSDYYLDAGSAVLVNDKVYFFAAIRRNENIKNVLFSIDAQAKQIEQYEKEEDSSLPGLSIFQIGESVITLKNEREDNEIITYLEIFDPATETWKKGEERTYNAQSVEGNALYAMCTDGKNIYVIEDIYGENRDFESYLIQYDQELKEIRRILLDGDTRAFLRSGKGRITEMRVWNERIFYLKNISSYGFLGAIEEDRITKIMEEKEFLPIKSLFQNESPLLYLRGGTHYYAVDQESGDIEIGEIFYKNVDDTTLMLLSSPQKIVAVTYMQEERPQKEIMADRSVFLRKAE